MQSRLCGRGCLQAFHFLLDGHFFALQFRNFQIIGAGVIAFSLDIFLECFVTLFKGNEMRL